MRVLVIEDDREVAGYVAKVLTEAGHLATIAEDGTDGLVMATSEEFDVLVVDRMLPRLDGLALIQALRASDCRVPVLILSALGEVTDRVKGLRAGGDDYLAKPFDFGELRARLRALGRRARPAVQPVLERGGVRLEAARRSASREGRTLDLTRKEFAVLQVLLEGEGAVVSAEELLDRAWDEHTDPFTNVVRVTIMKLRKSLGEPPLIETVRGVGYRIP